MVWRKFEENRWLTVKVQLGKGAAKAVCMNGTIV